MQTEGAQYILYASFYLIAQHSHNDKLKNHFSTALTHLFELGFTYDDNNRFKKQSSDCFEELRSYSFNIIAQVLNQTYSVKTECYHYALEAVEVVADHFSSSALPLHPSVYMERLLVLFPTATQDESAAHHFSNSLNRLMPLLSEPEQQRLKNIVHGQLSSTIQKFINTKPSKRFVNSTILIHAPIWYQPFISLLNDDELIDHQLMLLQLLKEPPALDLMCFCYQWLNLLRHYFDAEIVALVDSKIICSAISYINSRIGRTAICLTSFMNISACLSILNSDEIHSQLDSYILQQLLLSNMKSIIMSQEFEFSLANIWQHLSLNTRNLLLAEIIIVYAECNYKQKKFIASAIASIAHSLSETEKIQCLTAFIKDGQFVDVDTEFLEFSELLVSICNNFKININASDLITVSIHLVNKLSSFEQIKSSNSADFYIKLLIYLAINQQLSESLAARLTTQLIDSLVSSTQTKRNSNSPRTLRYYLEEIVLYIRAITRVIAYLTPQQRLDSIIRASRALLPIFEQKSEVRNVSFRPVLHAILELIRLDKDFLLDANDMSLAIEIDDDLKRHSPDESSEQDHNHVVTAKSPALSNPRCENTPLKRVRETVAAFILNRNKVNQDLLLAFKVLNPEPPLREEPKQSLASIEDEKLESLSNKFLATLTNEQTSVQVAANARPTIYSSSALILNNQSPIFSRQTTTTSSAKVSDQFNQYDSVTTTPVNGNVTETLIRTSDSPRTAESYKLDSRM